MFDSSVKRNRLSFALMAIMVIPALCLADDGWRKPAVQPEVHRLILAVDVDHDAFENHFKGSEEELDRRLREEFIPALNEAFTPETGILWELGPVVARPNVNESPYADSHDGYEIYRRLRENWEPRDDEFDRVICFTDRRIGVAGLAGGKWTVLTGVWGAWWHELSHTFGNPHGGRGTLETGSMSQRNDRRLLELEKTHRYTDTEVDSTWRILAENADRFERVQGPIDPYPPYARLDLAVIDSRTESSIIIDPLDNDHDINGDRIRISSFDSITRFGGSVKKTIREDDGVEVLRYTPPPGGRMMPDRFMYTLEDESGRTNRGHVVVQVLGTFDKDTEYEITHTEEGRAIAGETDGKINIGIHGSDLNAIAPLIRWKLEPAEEGGFYLHHVHTGMYLGYAGPRPSEGAEVLFIDPAEGQNPPRWTITHHSGVYFTLQPYGSELRLLSPYPASTPLTLGRPKNEVDKGYRSQFWVIDPLQSP
ncbi:MAG: hypothetical protein D6698_17000 [Gammaproteobacteria bacterium]|nr:MAG: hypothetical protein D6698_17000 [Gammaproteobacteria bacterium]